MKILTRKKKNPTSCVLKPPKSTIYKIHNPERKIKILYLNPRRIRTNPISHKSMNHTIPTTSIQQQTSKHNTLYSALHVEKNHNLTKNGKTSTVP